MDIFKDKGLSFEDLSQSFGAIAFPLHVWTILNVLMIFPAWLLRLSIWELVGGISYPLVDALLESAVLWVGMVGLSLILPQRWFANQFAALSSALAWLLTGWAVAVQYNFGKIIQWGPEFAIPVLMLVVLSFGLSYWLIRRYGRVEGWVKTLTAKLSVLTFIYIVFDLLGLIVIVLRNL